jgi:hypothetical protein
MGEIAEIGQFRINFAVIIKGDLHRIEELRRRVNEVLKEGGFKDLEVIYQKITPEKLWVTDKNPNPGGD